MFERYTDEARRVVFIARYEAARVTSTVITPDHLLLGILRESKPVAARFLESPESFAKIERQIMARSPAAEGKAQPNTTVDLPLDQDARAVLAWAADEADALDNNHIGPQHLFLALLRNRETPTARILAEHGAVYERVRREFASGASVPDAGSPQIKAPSLSVAVARFRELVDRGACELPKLQPAFSEMPLKPGGWSRREVLGHLIDSASNNHQRFVRALTSVELSWPNYEQEAWVKVQAYGAADWEGLVALWSAYNRHLLHIIRQIPEDKIGTVCRIGEHPPMTLGGLVAGYLDHLEHHLHQILG